MRKVQQKEFLQKKSQTRSQRADIQPYNTAMIVILHLYNRSTACVNTSFKTLLCANYFSSRIQISF